MHMLKTSKMHVIPILYNCYADIIYMQRSIAQYFHMTQLVREVLTLIITAVSMRVRGAHL